MHIFTHIYILSIFLHYHLHIFLFYLIIMKYCYKVVYAQVSVTKCCNTHPSTIAHSTTNEPSPSNFFLLSQVLPSTPHVQVVTRQTTSLFCFGTLYLCDCLSTKCVQSGCVVLGMVFPCLVAGSRQRNGGRFSSSIQGIGGSSILIFTGPIHLMSRKSSLSPSFFPLQRYLDFFGREYPPASSLHLLAESIVQADHMFPIL